jgi:4'-phosphopantetheinyl transferase
VKSTSEASSEPTTTRALEWCTPPPELSLPAHAVHVWRADLGLEAAYLRRLERNLSADERTRASRFRFARDRDRFVGARGLLREILAPYLNASPGRLSFGYGAHGKPFLAEEEHSTLHFNVSHSFDAMLLAIAHLREVGVDVEGVSNIGLAIDEIGDTVLSEPEKQVLARFDGEDKRTNFLQFWTLKEAYIKADGQGVSLPLERIDVSAPDGRVAVLDEAAGEWRTCPRWKLRTLAPVPGYVAALAAEGQDWRLALWHWSPKRAERTRPPRVHAISSSMKSGNRAKNERVPRMGDK